MLHMPVKSSAIQSVGYDTNLSRMEVKFKSGKTYTYENVSQADFEDLRDAESVGEHFNENFQGRES